MVCRRFSCIVLTACFWVSLARCATPGGDIGARSWMISDPILRPGPPGSFDEVAVKDPSVVFSGGQWHVFYTARSKTEYTTGYVAAEALADLNISPRHELKMIRGKSRYGCAPQILFYTPQSLWYLVFQSRDSNYQPMFSTTASITKPESWSEPAALLDKDLPAKWIDFWILCDTSHAYLFYTQSHRDVIVRSTSLTAFPHGWNQGTQVLAGVHEAVHIYKVKDSNTFHMIYELNRQGIRSFGLATAEAPTGPWRKVTDHYAGADQLRGVDTKPLWTDVVSHGELLRGGCNERMEYDPARCRWLIQGLSKEDLHGPYETLPWKIGILARIQSGKGTTALENASLPIAGP